MKESSIENYLKNQVGKLGGLCLKFISPGQGGVPDRIVILPGGRIVFVELKTRYGTTSRLQEYVGGKLRTLACDVRTVRGRDQAEELVKELRDGI